MLFARLPGEALMWANGAALVCWLLLMSHCSSAGLAWICQASVIAGLSCTSRVALLACGLRGVGRRGGMGV